MTTQIRADRDRDRRHRAAVEPAATSWRRWLDGRTTATRPSGAGIFLAGQGARRRGPQVRSGCAEVFGGLHGLA